MLKAARNALQQAVKLFFFCSRVRGNEGMNRTREQATTEQKTPTEEQPGRTWNARDGDRG
jgi:hypothetical protein